MLIINLGDKNFREHMTTRIRWTSEEQDFLKHLKDNERVESWKQIAEKMCEEFQDSSRSGKQCRQRSINYARFDQKEAKSSPWTLEDDEKFTKLYFQHGAKWACIGKHMPEKSQNCLKNRFYGGLRRLIRKINKIEKNLKARKTKPLRYETLMRVLDYKFSPKESSLAEGTKGEEFQNFLHRLKTNLLQETWNVMNQIQSDFQVFELVENIHEFNARIRGLTFKKSKNIENVKEILLNLERLRSTEPSTLHPQSSTVQKSSFHGGNVDREEENIAQQCQTVQQKEIRQHQEQNQMLEEFQEMAKSTPRTQWLSNSDDFDFEISSILQEEFKTQAFCFFY